jgi:hypothetical protein
LQFHWPPASITPLLIPAPSLSPTQFKLSWNLGLLSWMRNYYITHTPSDNCGSDPSQYSWSVNGELHLPISTFSKMTTIGGKEIGPIGFGLMGNGFHAFI